MRLERFERQRAGSSIVTPGLDPGPRFFATVENARAPDAK